MDWINSLPLLVFQYHFTDDDQFQIDQINSHVISCLGISPSLCYENSQVFLEALSTQIPIRTLLKEACMLACNLTKEISVADKRMLLNITPLESSRLEGVGVLTDISPQFQEMQAIRQQIQFLISAQNQLSDLFYYKDRDSRYLGGNRAWSRLHGEEDPQRLIGKSDMDSPNLPDELKQQLLIEEQLLMRHQESVRKREHVISNSGDDIYYESLKTPFFNDQHEVIGLVGVTRDVTEQVLTEIALQQAQEEALHLAQVKSSFLAVMSHEIRTPMNGVIGCASLLNETELNEEQRQLLNTIQSSGESLLVIINDILDYSKIDAGKMEFDQSPFDLRTLIEECLELFSKQVNEKGLEINYLLAQDLPAILIGDSSRIRQIINNLLGNAIKFTEKGEVFVDVSLVNKDPETLRCEILFAIKDTGIGIAKENQAQLFNAFSQADGSITRRYGGTGLGLAISKKIVEQMHGKLWLESEIHRGSTFFVSLNLPFDDSQQQQNIMTEIEGFKGLKCLIVDDNATNRRVLSNTLLQWGMQVAAFETPEATLENLELGQIYDLIILDFCMPRVSGGMLARKIQTFPQLRNKPIVILSSAHVNKKDWPEVNATLMKPVRTNTLKRTLLQLMGHQEHKSATHDHLVTQHQTRLLVVEDNHVNQMVVTMMLKKLGYQNVSCVADGQEAIEAVRQREPDIILMDIQMDRMDGYTATRIIRLEKNHPSKPWIIALTAGVQAEDSDNAYNAGMNDFITKPVQLKTLAVAMENALANTAGTI